MRRCRATLRFDGGDIMDVLDYGLSFIGSEGPANAVRFWVESRTCIIDDRAGTEEQYVQCGACKSEHTFAEQNQSERSEGSP